MAKSAGKQTIKDATKKDMKALGIYKTEYDRLIDIYAELVAQYNHFTDQFNEKGRVIEVGTGQGGSKKSPIMATLETLRKDILAYSDRLCLNPKALETVTAETKKTSALAAALSQFEEG